MPHYTHHECEFDSTKRFNPVIMHVVNVNMYSHMIRYIESAKPKKSLRNWRGRFSTCSCIQLKIKANPKIQ